MKKGLIFVISAPSGAGKTTVIDKFLEDRDDFVISVSATTRPPRTGEVNGRHYYFHTVKQFRDLIKRGEFLEHAKILENYYGTPKEPVIRTTKTGKNVIMDVDIQGAKSLKKKIKDCVTIFIIPPSFEELENRLKNRRTDSAESIRKRLELGKKELKERKKYDYILINDSVENAVKNLGYIVNLEIKEKNQTDMRRQR
jgi:guanylate kinase